MAVVFLARDLRHDRDVALKVLRPELAATLGPDRFLHEIHLAAGLAHPNILPLHDSGEADGCLYYVMPFVTGESLRDRLEQAGQLPLGEALVIAKEVADALDYAHQAGVVHRDIKPENILLQAGHAVVSDFGIARAISAAGSRVRDVPSPGGSRRSTGHGIAVGTPDYMSPEQAAGSATSPIDGRSDIYSLGCVLFEMLSGQPPTSITPPEGPNAGLLRPRDRLAELVGARPSVPPEVAAVVARMLAPLPADRFDTAAILMDALAEPSAAWTPRSLAARRRRRAGIGLAVGAALVALAILVLPNVFGAGLDRSLYLVASFEHRGTSAPGLLDGDKCELLLHSAFTRWEGVTVIGQPLANDSRARDGFQPATLERALAQARALRSGWLVWGQVWQFEDSNIVRAGLYDVARSRADREFTIRVALDLSDADAKFAQLADSLLLRVAGPPVSRAGAMGTRSLPAWQAYAEGQAALARWNLDSASRAFTQALLADPQYPQAALWLAQIDQWTGRPVEKWRRTATLAAGAGDRLAPQDRLMATGLVALVDQQYQAACTAYQQMVSRDSTDYVGWYGLGECRIRDRLVVREPTSPSGWAFRSSYGAAAEAYAHALRLVPSTHIAFGDTAFERLSRLLVTERDVFRQGYALTPDTVLFGAFPSLVRDTLAFVPYRLADALGDPRRFPATNAAAVQRNQIMLRGVTDAWLAAYPASPAVLETHALALETSGSVEPGRTPRRSALDAVREARRLARDPVQALRLAVAEARLLVKLGDFPAARARIDSLLAATAEPKPAMAALLVGPALLVGRARLAAALAPIGFADSALLTTRGPRAVMAPAWALLSYSSVGRPQDSILALRRRVSDAIQNYVAPGQREQVRVATLDEPAVEAFHELGVTDRHRPTSDLNFLLRLQHAFARGDSAAAHAGLDSVWVPQREWRTPSLSIDGTYLEAALYAKLGDTATATQVLDAALDAPLNLGTYTLAWITLPGNLVRAMGLRAQLAAAASDAQVAARWATGVVALWSGADAEFQPIVDSMRALAGSSRPRR